MSCQIMKKVNPLKYPLPVKLFIYLANNQNIKILPEGCPKLGVARYYEDLILKKENYYKDLLNLKYITNDNYTSQKDKLLTCKDCIYNLPFCSLV